MFCPQGKRISELLKEFDLEPADVAARNLANRAFVRRPLYHSPTFTTSQQPCPISLVIVDSFQQAGVQTLRGFLSPCSIVTHGLVPPGHSEDP